MNYYETTTDECYGCKSLAKRIELTERKLRIAQNALEEAVYLLDPTAEDMQKKAGVYRVVTALEKLKEKNSA